MSTTQSASTTAAQGHSVKPASGETSTQEFTFLGRHWKILLFTIVSIVVGMRGWYLFFEPRVWAEDGRYLGYALSHSIFRSILYQNPDSGYFLLSATIPAILSAWFAKTMGLLYAPLVDTYFSFAFQLIPFAVVIFGRSHLFRTRTLLVLGCAIVLFAPTADGMIWLNTINTLSWAGLTAMILLFEDTSDWSKRKRICMRALLVVLGLCGPYAAVMFPLFSVAYVIFREREKVVQSGVLLACAVAQAGMYEVSRHGAGMVSRLVGFTPDSAVVNAFFFFFSGAFLGEARSRVLCNMLGLSDAVRISRMVPRGGPVILAAWFCGLVMTVALLALWDKKWCSLNSLLVITFLFFAVFVAAASAFGIPSDRYTFLPGASLLFLVMYSAWRHRATFVRIVCGVLLASSLCIGASTYESYWQAMRTVCKPWAVEVEKWKTDCTYQPQVWPLGFPQVFEWSPLMRR